MKTSQTSIGNDPSKFWYIARQRIVVMPATTLAGSPLQRLARPFRSSIFARTGIRLRERQSLPAFLRKRRDPVEAARSTMDSREWFSNQCTMASLSKSFCTLTVVWLLRQLIPSDRECRIEFEILRVWTLLPPCKGPCRKLRSSFLNLFYR